MRVIVAAIAVVAGFAMGAWCIARLAPESPDWLKVTLGMIWLFALICGAILLGSKESRWEREDQRRLLGYGLLAAVLMALVLLPIFKYHIKIPKWAAQAIVAAIAGVVFLLSKHMGQRKNHKAPLDDCR